MAYIGRNPAIGTQKVLDSLESQFNGTLTTFDLRYNGVPTYPTLSSSLIVSLGGVLQEPGEAYYVSSDSIVFASAPPTGADCWILLYSEYGVAAGSGSSGGAVSVATGEPMGHEERTDSDISFNNATRTFTVEPASGISEFVVWTKGTKRTYSTAQTVQIGTTTGLYYIYFDAFGVLQYRTTYFIWDEDTPTAYVYWNATTSSAVFVADERHGIVLDWQTHEYLHRTRGAVIANGFSISNYTTTGDGSADSDAQFDLGNGTFFDEDLEVGITHSATPSVGTFTQVLTGNAEIPVYYMSGSEGDWVKDTATEFACKQSGTTLQYNSLSGSTWSTTAANDNRYVVSWVVATNEINAPIIVILGQDHYNKIGKAEEAVWGDLTLTNFPIFEFRPLWKVIFRTKSTYTNTPNAYIANVLDLREISSTGIAGTIVSDHGLLSGLTDDDHAQYLNTTVDRAGVTANISTTGNITGANLIATGQLQGPANFIIDPAAVGDNTGTVIIAGDLQIDGTTTTIKNLDLKNLSQINSEIADTAVDVFVYDTRKDSDGGAWRKRTQSTSWYNETLGTATRGSRKEFPAVAVIVCLSNYIKIYDGDDPDLPMWMVFNYGTLGSLSGMNMLYSDGKAISALNGIISSVGYTYWHDGLTEINFLADFSRFRNNSNVADWSGGIGTRNTSGGYGSFYNTSSMYIISANANDVAMTVLPNAPIDPSTGLPIPTIAVATNGGVSVIKDDGSVVDITHWAGSAGYNKTDGIEFLKNDIVFSMDSVYRDVFKLAIPSSDLVLPVASDVIITSAASRTNAIRVHDPIVDMTTLKVTSDGVVVAIPSLGISKVLDAPNYSTTLASRITSSYNTGWMHGDVKGAFLSDTDATNAVASTNLASGMTFKATDRLTSHTYDDGDTSWQMVDNSGTNNGYVQIYLNGTTPGKQYLISLDIDSNPTLDSGYSFNVYSYSTTSQIATFSHWNGSGASTLTAIYTSTHQGDDSIAQSDVLTIYINATTANITNFTVREATEADRSVNNKGLAVYGTITKSAVATGADLVSYGPFSTSNRLRQSYNSDLTFGTNDFSVIFWMNNSGTNIHQSLIGRDNREFAIDILDNTNYSRAFRIYSNNSSNSLQLMDSNTNPFPINTWSQICVNYTGGNTATVYVNGVFNKTGTLDYDIDDTSHGFNIGARNTSGSYAHAATGTQLALVRVSASAPSPEQIKKIYEDEKVLFQENAKATLYGSSDAVTALAYDDTTNLLHVGTSGGRSTFSGLKRVENTTTAVATAISASNGLVAEQ